MVEELMNEEEGNIEEKRGVKLGEMDLGLNLFKGKRDQELFQRKRRSKAWVFSDLSYNEDLNPPSDSKAGPDSSRRYGIFIILHLSRDKNFP